MRIWAEVNIEDISAHLAVCDDKYAYCPGCKKLGISLENLSKCPECGRIFKYITSSEATRNKKNTEMIIRIKKKVPNMTFIDYEDYDHLLNRNKAKNLFNLENAE